MEQQEQESILQKAVKMIRDTVRTVKVIPYLFLLLYCFCLVASCSTNKTLVSILDYIYGTSLCSCIFMLLLSKTLDLCAWHKIACVIPVSSFVVSIIDSYVFSFSFEEIVFINISTLILVICYLVWSFFHFFIDGK